MCFMKTKIIYISGNEIFDVRDIRAAFEEVRNALNLDANTVLFGIPVDSEDAGFATKTVEHSKDVCTPNMPEDIPEQITETQTFETVADITDDVITPETQTESITEQTTKKRGRPRKEIVAETAEEIIDGQNQENAEKTADISDEIVVPILSVLSTKDETTDDDLEIIPEISDNTAEQPTAIEIQSEEIVVAETDDDEADLEKLLSAMKPLEEDIAEEQSALDIIQEQDSVDDSVDATLEQLATEFAENQDKIAAETKSNSRSKIGKLRNILPFKQSKHKDQGLGDLFGWAGIAANDEEFSVPGFFTSVASKK